MNKLKIIFIGICFLSGINAWAHNGKATQVMEEMIKFHDALVKETPGKLNTTKLTELLNKGADREKDAEAFKKAIPLAEKLGKLAGMKEKLDVYAELVEILSSVVGHHDKSNANVFFCPMVKKKWIAKGDTIINPYLKDMRDCGEKQ
ncbi:MAG TPA: hypothetical protein PK079_23735 [Leptospiraceae bacterium]|nr:hypothetical protein [Leptospiraceae bacterium]HMW05379.1 hypothetical protein [Leptospiraceae bacterium]HMX32823.1 hypothetical protein [Leptospiraceae bacterium]HMY33863.1 hypothetical protein [Leptospiraceae bacterium]HMZ64481.1 hypothetical protein [Leptospiraceae bacterium]